MFKNVTNDRAIDAEIWSGRHFHMKQVFFFVLKAAPAAAVEAEAAANARELDLVYFSFVLNYIRMIRAAA